MSKLIYAVPFILGLFTVVISGLIFLMYSADQNEIKLEVVNVMSQIIVAVAALLAFVNYFESIKDRKIKEAVNLVSFIRESIIPVQTDITKLAKKFKGNDFNYIKLESFDVENIESSYVKLSRSDFDSMSSLPSNDEIYSLQISLLNKLEEFSLKVRLYDLVSHEALKCVWATFTEILEINAYTISYQKTVGISSSLYSEQLSLYKQWDKFVYRESPEIRFKNLKQKVQAVK